ncbi:hypothetical protein OV208_24610 [Corallococcus sp. bb12-1]|uniref:hypothetical protein n=1 Tax=Corallococcus sp. bb12-1 TaxID=2996784 RepID=UPI00227036DF|nr:hypothetical protein [Corallococcus sp. bb12-1]MCY1044525.1 hypothetical protein [Corallococcus sp. bb12-1]
MRLREIQKHLEAAQVPAAVRVEYSDSGNAVGAGVKVENLNTWRRAITHLNQAEVFDPILKDVLRNKLLMEGVSDTARGSPAQLGQMISQLELLGKTAAELLNFLTAAIPEHSPNTLVIQIQEPDALQSLAALIDELAKFFTLLARAEEGADESTIGTPSVQAFDTGSFYLEVVLATAAGVTTVGMITTAAFRFLQQYQQFQAMQETLRAYKAVAADVQSLQTQSEFARAAFLQAQVDRLKAGRFAKAEKEAQAALGASIQECAKLMHQGVRLLPSLSTDSATQNMFPSIESLRTLSASTDQKLLTPDASTPPRPKDK